MHVSEDRTLIKYCTSYNIHRIDAEIYEINDICYYVRAFFNSKSRKWCRLCVDQWAERICRRGNARDCDFNLIQCAACHIFLRNHWCCVRTFVTCRVI